jgi:hypothetical protein
MHEIGLASGTSNETPIRAGIEGQNRLSPETMKYSYDKPSRIMLYN